MGRRMVRKTERQRTRQNMRPPWKIPQQQRRDTPPLLDGVASVAVLRFTPEGGVLVLGVEDRDKRKARKRKGILVSQVVLPGGRRKHNEGDGKDEMVHITAQKEGLEEMGAKVPLTELLPLALARRVGTGATGRDSFDRELKAGNEVQFPHFVFGCIGDTVEPRQTEDKDACNPRWYSFWDEILVSPEETPWSFDQVTLLTYTLKSLGGFYNDWVWNGWRQDTLPGEVLGNAFFAALLAILKTSPEVDGALRKLEAIDFEASIAARMSDPTKEGKKERAQWYLGYRRGSVPKGKKKGLFIPDSFSPLGDTRTYFEALAALKTEQDGR